MSFEPIEQPKRPNAFVKAVAWIISAPIYASIYAFVVAFFIFALVVLMFEWAWRQTQVEEDLK